MRKYIPNEMFNRIPYPESGHDATGIDSLVSKIMYKVPGASEVAVKRETWLTVCDFCNRTGALLEKMTVDDDGVHVNISPSYGKFMRVVGCGGDGGQLKEVPWSVEGSQLVFGGSDTGYYAIVSVLPDADGLDETNKWNPKVPKYIIDRYGECLLHGALMRVYAMANEPWGNIQMARMHAVAYNNELNRLSFGLITSGMRKHLLINVEDFIVNMNGAASSNGNG